MSLVSPVSCNSDAFYFYRVVFFLILYTCCHQTNHICSIISLTNILFLRFFFAFWWFCWCCYCFGVWHFLPTGVESNKSQVQRNVLALKFLIFFKILKLIFIVIVVVRLCLTHSNRFSFTKNIIRRNPMGTISRPSDSISGGTETTAYIQCINGREPQSTNSGVRIWTGSSVSFILQHV